MKYNRIKPRRKVLFVDGEYRMIRVFIVYGEISIDVNGYDTIYSNPTLTWEIQQCTMRPPHHYEVSPDELEKRQGTDGGLFTFDFSGLPLVEDWRTIHYISDSRVWLPPVNDVYTPNYIYARGAERTKLTKHAIGLGRDWLAKHKRMVARGHYQLRCRDIDGEGTACPLLDSETLAHCYISSMQYAGYGGGRPGRPIAEHGACNLPTYNQSCMPGNCDAYDNTILYYRRLAGVDKTNNMLERGQLWNGQYIKIQSS